MIKNLETLWCIAGGGPAGIVLGYLSRNPEESILGDAKSQAGSITRGVLFVAIVGPVFFVISLYVKGWLPGSTGKRI